MKLQFDSVCIFIIAAFFPPQTDVYEILSDITDAIPSQVNIPILLCRDFNCRLKITGDREVSYWICYYIWTCIA